MLTWQRLRGRTTISSPSTNGNCCPRITRIDTNRIFQEVLLTIRVHSCDSWAKKLKLSSYNIMKCQICLKIGKSYHVDNDRGERLPAETSTFQKMDRAGEIRQCPVCHTFFRYISVTDNEVFCISDDGQKWFSRDGRRDS